uniref:Uncharacterized protein n=1 Tax=Hippocampus comes TaxID=109280 RepID=A0A3Q2XUQ7_HIPCM
MDACAAMPTVVPSKALPLRHTGTRSTRKQSAGRSTWRGRSSLVRHSRKLLSVALGFFSTRILSRSLHTSKPVSATRTFSGR